MGTILDQLTDALTDYLNSIETVTAVAPVAAETKQSEPEFAGEGFGFAISYHGTQRITAVMVDIERLFERIYRYTSQKSRFIAVNGERATGNGRTVTATTQTDLYTFSPDEKTLYLQFLKEGADRLWELLMVYSKKLPFKGYLFDEGVAISEPPAVDNVTWTAGSFVRVEGKIYKAIQDVSENIEISDRDYWKEVSVLYATRGKVVYFIHTNFCESQSNYMNEIPWNALQDLLHTVENALYSFVLWRWYTMAGLGEEAAMWYGSFEVALASVRSISRRRVYPIRRPIHPF
ncbi:MAG: hypothetical protein LBD87_06300 [Prevotellaceae bacterium]|jgi:hypothetical protein|nr:hypothetical protein [Prevotellaceae bacterium]